jgi:hypothetical protein
VRLHRLCHPHTFGTVTLFAGFSELFVVNERHREQTGNPKCAALVLVPAFELVIAIASTWLTLRVIVLAE